MNKNLVIGLGGLVGIGAAVLLFLSTQPSGPKDGPEIGAETVGSVESEETRDPRNKVEVGAIKKDPEAAANPNPLAAQAMENRDASFGEFATMAGPTWQHLAMELHNSDAELSTACREMSKSVHAASRDADADVAAELARQRELLEEVKAAPATESTPEIIEKLEGLLAELEEGA